MMELPAATRFLLGPGPLAGKIWRVGLMGASSSAWLVTLLITALETAAVPRRQPLGEHV